MRRIFASLSCLVFATVLHAQLPGTAGTNANPFMDEQKAGTTDDLRSAIVKYPYKWFEDGNESIRFDANGTGEHIGGTTHFDIRWHVKNAQEIEIERSDGRGPPTKARIKFSADYTTFAGVEFDGHSPVKGHQMVPDAQAPAAGATPGATGGMPNSGNSFSGTNDDLRKAIAKNSYTWEIAGTGAKNIKFDANGTGAQSDFQFKWRILDPQSIEIVAVDAVSGKAKAVLKFSADYTSYEGVNFDGVSQIKGSQVVLNP